MTAYILRRIAISVVITIGVAAITFAMLHVIAPSPGRAVLGDHASQFAVNAFDKSHGYDRPVWDQFATYLNQLIHGNLGFSYKEDQTVNSLLAEDWERSAYLTGVALFIAIALAIPLGILQAVKRNTFVDQGMTALAFTLYSMPDNFLGLLLIALFAVQLGWFPAQAS
jgi:peptide/nickel transport system permease protein